MFFALALAAVLVHPGDTLSGIAAGHGISLASVEAANPQIADPDLIYAGQTVHLPGGAGGGGGGYVSHHRASHHHYAAGSGSVAPGPVRGASSGDLASVPGVPRAFAACVALRESSNGTNQAYNGGVYGIITASGINVNGQPLSVQKQAFAKLYAQYGTSPWTPSDHC